MPKERIIELLGERKLLLPDLVRRALDANDRVKFLLTLLQSARVAADHGGDMPDLREERLASGVEDAALDRVVGKSSRRADGVYMIPGAEQLARRALAEVARMIAPLRVAETRGAEALVSRLDQLSGAVAPEGDAISDSDISALTAGPGGEDSLHLLVMDAHRELNALEAASRERLDRRRARPRSGRPRTARSWRRSCAGAAHAEHVTLRPSRARHDRDSQRRCTRDPERPRPDRRPRAS